MRNEHIILGAFVGGALIACAAVAGIAYKSIGSDQARTVAVTQSQQAELDALVQRL